MRTEASKDEYLASVFVEPCGLRQQAGHVVSAHTSFSSGFPRSLRRKAERTGKLGRARVALQAFFLPTSHPSSEVLCDSHTPFHSILPGTVHRSHHLGSNVHYFEHKTARICVQLEPWQVPNRRRTPTARHQRDPAKTPRSREVTSNQDS